MRTSVIGLAASRREHPSSAGRRCSGVFDAELLAALSVTITGCLRRRSEHPTLAAGKDSLGTVTRLGDDPEEAMSQPVRALFHIDVKPDLDDGGFVAFVRELPGVGSQGETEQEAVDAARDALRCAMDVILSEQPTGTGDENETQYLISA